jgi:MFS family permease
VNEPGASTSGDSGIGRIWRLVSARTLNMLGRQMIGATVLWELYERTHSKLTLGVVGLVQVIPVIALFLPSGHLADRYDRRWLSTVAALIVGFIGAGLAIASWFAAPVAVYLVLLLLLGCATSLHSPASSALIPMIIPRDQFERANRIGSSLQELTSIVGPTLPGVALLVMDATWVYAAVAATGLSSAAMYLSLPRPRASEDTPNTNAARRDWRAGLRFIFRSKLLLPAITLDLFAVLFAGAVALLPAVAIDVLHVGSFGYGVLRAASSLGAVAMALIGGRLAPWKRPGRVLLIVVALFGAVTVMFGLSTSFALSFAILVIGGALDNISVVIRVTLEQLVVPDSIRGRVSAVHYVFIGMSNELGAAESGFAAQLVGTVPAIVGGGAIAIAVVGVVALAWPALARMPPLAELSPEEKLELELA